MPIIALSWDSALEVSGTSWITDASAAASNQQMVTMDGNLFPSMLFVHLVVDCIIHRNKMHLQS